MYTVFLGNLLIIFEKISIEIVINQVELKLGNIKVADKIKLNQ